MNLNHRVADIHLKSSLDVVLHKIEYPLNIMIPVCVLSLSIWSLWVYAGQAWDVGTFSTALLPILTNALAEVFHVEHNIMLSYFVIGGVTIGPLAFYLYAYLMTHRHLPAVITALLTIAPLLPFSAYSDGRTLLALTSGDGAHVAAFSFIPLASIAFLRFLQTGSLKNLSIFISLVLVPIFLSFFSLFILFIFLIFSTISEILVGQGRLKILRFLKAGGILLILAILTYNISLVGIFMSGESQLTVLELLNLLPLSFFIVPVLGTFAFLIFDRRPNLQPLFLALSFLVTFGLLHFVRISFIESAIFRQSRYKAEVAFAVALTAGLVLMWTFDLIRAGKLLKRMPFLNAYRTLVAYLLVAVFIGTYAGGIIFIQKSPY